MNLAAIGWHRDRLNGKAIVGVELEKVSFVKSEQTCTGFLLEK